MNLPNWKFVKAIGFKSVLAIVLTFALTAAFGEAPGPGNAIDRQLVQLGPGDSVSIQINGEPDKADGYIGDDGTVRVPLIGPVQVTGLSPIEASKIIEAALIKHNFYRDPHVTVLITQPNSQLVSVLGEVANSGRYPITPKTTIVDLLALAGGLHPNASDVIYLIRKDSQGQTSRFEINLTGLGNISRNLPAERLQGGDSLFVPVAKAVLVNGEVTTPGSYRLVHGMTVAQAIASAGGITPRGSERRIELKRLGPDGNYIAIRPKPGDSVQPDDIIRVKESIF